MANQFHDLCARLNVKPKQFAILLTITVSSIGILGVKFFVLKPRKAGAEVAAANAGNDAAGGASAGGGMHVDGNAAPMATVAVTLATRPERDPFAPFFVYRAPEGEDGTASEDGAPVSDGQGVLVAPRTVGPNKSNGAAPAGQANANAKNTGKAGAKSTNQQHSGNVPGAMVDTSPQGLYLKAIIAGRVAVMNDVSVEVGDIIYDDAGQAFTVMSIQDRSITLSDGHRTYPVGYARPQAAGSKHTKAPGR